MMKLTLEMILYFIRALKPVVCGAPASGASFIGVKQYYAEDMQIQQEYLYVGNLSEVQETCGCCAILAANDQNWTEQEAGRLSACIILVDPAYGVPYLMNLMIDIFNRLTGWEKSMHIAALENKNIQTLIEISEQLLEHFTIIFDASFDVIAYTKQTSSTYQGFRNTIKNGYSEVEVMRKIKEKGILKRLRPGEALAAPSAGDDNRTNIYQSFYSDQILLGYACVFYDGRSPDPGYLDVFRLFAENLNIYLKRDYQNQRYGQMKYETFLTNLIHSETFAKGQLSEQIQYIDDLQENGRFSLAVIAVDADGNSSVAFLTRMIARQFWNIRPFLYQNHICLLKIQEGEYSNSDDFSRQELDKIQEVFVHYSWHMGVSNVFTHITDLRYAYAQCTVALQYGLSGDGGATVSFYRNYQYFHLFSEMEEAMPIEMFRSEFYQELKHYDACNDTCYLDTILCYLEHDCNATHTAEALYLHRNTVRNMVRFVEEHWNLSLSDREMKKQLVLSEMAEQYLSWSHRRGV